MPIPRVIYQTWCTNQFHPLIYNKINNMIKMNPGYDYRLFTDDDMDEFVNTNYPGEIADAYNKLNIIVAKADFWRYLVLYKNGGVYLDIDSTILTPLDSFIKKDDEAIISAEGTETQLQWALIFNKEHPILKKTIDYIVDNIQNNRYTKVGEMTGPFIYTKAINSIHSELFNEDLRHDVLYNKKYNKEYVDNESENILNIEFNKNEIKYRFYGRDFCGNLQFKYPEHQLLYETKRHWHNDERELAMLKN